MLPCDCRIMFPGNTCIPIHLASDPQIEIGDFRIGSTGRAIPESWATIDVERLQEWLDGVVDMHKDGSPGVVILSGDCQNSYRPSTRERLDVISAGRPELLTNIGMQQKIWNDEYMIPLFLPMLQKCKGLVWMELDGHHFSEVEMRDKDNKKVHIRSTPYRLMKLQELSGRPCIYLGEMCAFIRFFFTPTHKSNGGKHGYIRKFFVQHGTGSGGVNKLARIYAKHFRADVLVRGHDCTSGRIDLVEIDVSGRCGNPRIVENDRLLIQLGALSKNYSSELEDISYAERKMLPPGSMRWSTVFADIRRSGERGNYDIEFSETNRRMRAGHVKM